MHQLSHRIQRFCLVHRNPLTKTILSALTLVDIAWYSVVGAIPWVQARKRACGPRFCGLGRCVETDYNEVRKLISGYQLKTSALGRMSLIRGRFSSGFPLFLDNGDAHEASRDLINSALIEGAAKRTNGEVADFALAALVKSGDVQFWIIKWLYFVLGGIDLEFEIVEDLQRLFYGPGFLPGLFLLRRISPIGYLVPGYHGRGERLAREWINPPGSTEDERWTMLETIAIAAALGLESLANSIMDLDLAKTKDYSSIRGSEYFFEICNSLGLEFVKKTFMEENFEKAKPIAPLSIVRELLRRNPPVNNTIQLLAQDTIIHFDDRDVLMPAGTPMSANVGATGWDESVFPHPEKFDPGRGNLEQALNFNEPGRRGCPGKDLALLFGVALLEKRLKERTEARIGQEMLKGYDGEI